MQARNTKTAQANPKNLQDTTDGHMKLIVEPHCEKTGFPTRFNTNRAAQP